MHIYGKVNVFRAAREWAARRRERRAAEAEAARIADAVSRAALAHYGRRASWHAVEAARTGLHGGRPMHAAERQAVAWIAAHLAAAEALATATQPPPERMRGKVRLRTAGAPTVERQPQ